MKLFVKMFVVLAVLLLTANVRAQMPQQLSDPAVRVGKLPNGLTYYIRHNEYPKGQVFYQSVSSGTQVEKGTTVQYMVSKGSQPSAPDSGNSGNDSGTEENTNQ